MRAVIVCPEKPSESLCQVFAPAEDDVVAYEPMTAPTNALVDGGAALPVLAAGERFRAEFAITVE